MPDRHAVLWTRVGGAAMKMASVVATPRECRIGYSDAFVASGLPGFSLLADPALVGSEAVVRPATARMPLHPRLMALIPPEGPGNIQRRVYAEILARRRPPPAPGFETEWEMLLLAGRNGIGHVDVFADDLAATEWYRDATPAPDGSGHGSRSRIWRILREEVRQQARAAREIRDLEDILGPTPSVGGMVAKVLMSIPDRPLWTGAFARPGRVAVKGEPYVDVIVKIEQPQYDGLLDLEALCLDLHRELGFAVPRHWRLDLKGLRLLAVERFDRTPGGLPRPFESLLTVFAAGSRRVLATSDVEWPEVGRWIERLGRICSIDVRAARETLFRRLAVALLTGNGDMHLDNLGLLGPARALTLAPVYDPAPMRAWPRHDLRLAIPIDFRAGQPIYRQIAETGPAFGLPVKTARAILAETLAATRDYGERVMALAEVPEERRRQLVRVVEGERQRCITGLG